MRLKRLICHGFKSFADKTEFEFDAHLTGIIGPNGCGKSNVVDALKWVLGDQRARSLRGQEMTDVIFKGADGRDPMPAAEVTIVLEADPDEAGDGPAELVVGRRLTRDKESTYLLGGRPVRLKDVRDALLDTGLGVGAYSFMEQGRIDAVLSANPEDRRAIFEEAAGISRFKLQKREALRKLERTEQNLARVRDLVEERAKRIRSLKLQAGRARRYGELRARLLDLQAALAVVEARRLRADQEVKRSELDRLTAELRGLEEEHGRALARLGELDAEVAELAGALEEAQRAVHETLSRRDGAGHRSRAQEERARELAADVENAERQQRMARAQHAERERKVAQARQRLAELEERIVDLGRRLEERAEALEACRAEVKDCVARRERAREEVLEWIHRRTRARNAVHDEEAEIRGLDARDARIAQRLEELEGQQRELAAEKEAAAAALAATRAALARALEEERGLLEELAQADREAADLAAREAELRGRCSAVAGRLEALLDMEAHHVGLDQGARKVLELAPQGLSGRLLDLLTVDVAHSPALEAALGPFVQALVVDTRTHAEAIVRRLDAEKHGRVLLLVEDEFQDDGEHAPPPDLPAGAESLAQAVGCDPSMRRVVDWLLRGVCVVDDLSLAESRRTDVCFVTPRGELLCGPRLEGGRGEAQGGLVVRRAQILELQEQLARLEEELRVLTGGKRAANERVAALRESVRERHDAVLQARRAEQEAIGRAERLAARERDLAKENETLALEREEIRRQRLAALVRLGRHVVNLYLVERRERRAVDAERSQAELLAAAQQRLHEAQNAWQEFRVQQVAASRDREGVVGSLRVHEEALRDLVRTAEDLEARARRAREASAAAAAEAERCRQEAERLGRELAERQAERDRQSRRLEEARKAYKGLRAALEDLERRRAARNGDLSSARLALADLEHRFGRCEERLREETGIELLRCLGEVQGLGLVVRELPGPRAPAGMVEVLQGPPLPPGLAAARLPRNRMWEEADFDTGAAAREVQVLRAQIDRLGHVNLDAVRELAEMEESHAFLVQEVEDLSVARKQLMETLRRMETESRELFETTFRQARENFQAIFRKLFQGGRADMFLAEGEDTLEAGIRIVARPPGKQLQSINLMSGGERTLTALAILFSLFKVKPSPFCVLDEVDAALDDANVERFLRVLREFVGPTQFCVVTHHKRTMAECHVLYGITMQRRGISSRIAVSLEEVDAVTSGEKVGPGAS